MWKVVYLGAFLAGVFAQSNYDSQTNSIEYNAIGLPETSVLDGKVTKLDDLSPIIFLNRTKAALNCAAGFMQIDLKFEYPFYGIVYADFERSSACTIAGNGTTTARIELPLKGCGTRQDPTRVFTNNIVVRFHPSLEMDGDEVITIVCRYPPPVAPPAPAAPGSLLPPPPPPDIPLKGFQILLIICAILFLSLVLLGLAASYYCLRNQRIRVIRRHPLPLAAGSEITKLSAADTSTTVTTVAGGNLSMYEGLKIPRAHAHVTTTTATSISESEMAMVSGADTIPSDYPSESPSTSHSEAEDADGRSLRRSLSSSGSYENKAFEQYQHQQTLLTETEMVRLLHRPPPPQPKFDVEMRVKKAPLPSPTPSPSSSDTEGSVISGVGGGSAQERNLSTIDERDESVVEMTERTATTFAYKPEIHAPPASSPPPPPPAPIYSQVVRKKNEFVRREEVEREQLEVEEEEEEEEETMFERHNETFSQQRRWDVVEETEEPPLVAVQRRPEITSHFVDDVFLRTITEKKTIEDIERHRRQVTEYHAKRAPPPPPPPPPTKWDVEIRNYPNPNRAPSVGGAAADDSTTDWDTHSENSSIYGVPAVILRNHELRRTNAGAAAAAAAAAAPPTQPFSSNNGNSDRYYRSTLDIPLPNPPPPNWETLLKVLEYAPPVALSVPATANEASLSSSSSPSSAAAAAAAAAAATEQTSSSYRSEHALTLEDKKKWRKIITTESTLRTMLTEATVREDFERIRRDQRYEKLFEPAKWDVIIRVLTPPSHNQEAAAAASSFSDRLFDQRGGGGGGNSGSNGNGAGAAANRYRRKSEWDTRSRRSSLPTLYEYDSDGSSMRTLRLDGAAGVPSSFDALAARSRRTSRSSLRSDMDVRSMSEITVDFARQEVPDNASEGSSYYYRSRKFYDDDEDEDDEYDDVDVEDGASLVRSLSQPSLARSASEFTESWGIRAAVGGNNGGNVGGDGRNWDTSSAEHSPRSSTRSARDNREVASASSSSSYDRIVGGGGGGGSGGNSQHSAFYQQKRRWFESADTETSTATDHHRV